MFQKFLHKLSNESIKINCRGRQPILLYLRCLRPPMKILCPRPRPPQEKQEQSMSYSIPKNFPVEKPTLCIWRMFIWWIGHFSTLCNVCWNLLVFRQFLILWKKFCVSCQPLGIDIEKYFAKKSLQTNYNYSSCVAEIDLYLTVLV